uniref:C-type lectin domain-containing protein n=1 Tax=Amphilophus citrinellus TaxID=61819 RepID=A0A3Q0RHG6_AMPCI
SIYCLSLPEAQFSVLSCLPAPVSPCPSVFSAFRSWIDALEDCQKNHSSLAEISTDTVKNKVKSLLQNYTSLQRGVWIGLERSVFGYNTEWKWISGCKVVDSQLKTNNSNRHCGMISFNVNKEIELQDANCHDNLPFICQKFGDEPHLNTEPAHPLPPDLASALIIINY